MRDENKLGCCKQSYSGRKETRREGGTAGSDFVLLLKNESNSPSSPFAPSSFPANLSGPPSSDGFTGGEERKAAAEPTHLQTNFHLRREKVKKKTLRLVSASFLSEWESFSFLLSCFF